jgi:hypothetical protein
VVFAEGRALDRAADAERCRAALGLIAVASGAMRSGER